MARRNALAVVEYDGDDTALSHRAGQQPVLLGYWVSGDQPLRGAALNAVLIAEELLK